MKRNKTKNGNIILKDDYVQNVNNLKKGIVKSVYRARKDGRLLFEVSYLGSRKIEEKDDLKRINKKQFEEKAGMVDGNVSRGNVSKEDISNKEGSKWKRLFGTIFGWLF